MDLDNRQAAAGANVIASTISKRGALRQKRTGRLSMT